MAKEERSSEITTKLVLAFACMILLLFSLPSSLISMSVDAQNSTSSDTSNASSSSEDSESTDENSQSQGSDTSSSSSDKQTGSNQGHSNSSVSEETPPSNSTDISEESDSSTNSTASEETQNDSQSSNVNQTASSENDEVAGNATSTDTNSTSTADQNSNSTSTTDNPEREQLQNATSDTSESIPPSNSTEQTANQTQIEDPESMMNATSTEESILGNTTQTLVTISGEPLVVADRKLSRSFSYPLLEFQRETVAELAVTLTWDIDGTTHVEDNRGYSYTISIPESQGAFSLWYNSTHVDQRVIGPELEYDVYWSAVEGENGHVDKYKYTIAGTSLNGGIISFIVDGGNNDRIEDDKFFAGKSFSESKVSIPDPTLDWTPKEARDSNLAAVIPIIEESVEHSKEENGLVLDWSDALSAGFDILLNQSESIINIPVSTSFVIDPTVVTTISNPLSPGSADSFEKETRIISVGNPIRLVAFYYDGSNIVYRTSSDKGLTWSAATSLGTGALASDADRWSVVWTSYNDAHYIYVFYWVPGNPNTNMFFYFLRGTVGSSSISWSSPVELGYTSANSAICGSGGACAAVTTATDYNGTIYAVFRWISGGSSTYSYLIKQTTNGGFDWSDSLSQQSGISTNKPTFSIVLLNASKALLVYAKYESASLFYRFFDGSTWGSEQSITGTGMSENTYKQLSSARTGSEIAYVVYTNVTASSGGILKAVMFNSTTGSFGSIETAENTLSHRLPTVHSDGFEELAIFSLANNKIYRTLKIDNEAWQQPTNPFGTTFSSPDQLTSTFVLMGDAAIFWREGTSAPYNLIFDLRDRGTVDKYAAQTSPDKTDYYEGERRVISDQSGRLFTFYYDGNNILYKTSLGIGHTWSETAVSTGSGTLASDTYRWTVVYTQYQGTEYVVLTYWTPAGSSMNFYVLRGEIDESSITWGSPILLGYTSANISACGTGGACAAAVASTDTNGYIYAAFRYRSGGSSTYSYQIMRSTDAGLNWSVSLNQVDSVSANRPVMALTSLASGKMLFAYALYEGSDLKYRIFDGSGWGSVQSATGVNMGMNTIKQISADSVNTTRTAYVAYLSGGNSGTMHVARFSNITGAFNATETVVGIGDHYLPSISITPDDIVHVYCVFGDKIYETTRNETGWQAPMTPFGDVFDTPDYLTAQITGNNNTGAFWREGSTASSQYLIFDGRRVLKFTTAIPYPGAGKGIDQRFNSGDTMVALSTKTSVPSGSTSKTSSDSTKRCLDKWSLKVTINVSTDTVKVETKGSTLTLDGCFWPKKFKTMKIYARDNAGWSKFVVLNGPTKTQTWTDYTRNAPTDIYVTINWEYKQIW